MCPDQDRLVFPGKGGPGAGKRIVLISGDDEYRSEQALPQLAKILSERHGFDMHRAVRHRSGDGTIKPDQHDNIPGLETLETADLVVMLLAVPRPARRADEAHRRLRGIGQADRGDAHRDACLRHQDQPDLQPLELE